MRAAPTRAQLTEGEDILSEIPKRGFRYVLPCPVYIASFPAIVKLSNDGVEWTHYNG